MIQFGSYVFDPTFTVTEMTPTMRPGTAPLPLSEGSFVSRAWRQDRKVTVSGTLFPDDVYTLPEKLDALRAAVAGNPTTLTLDNGRFLKHCVCQEQVETNRPEEWGRYIDVRLTFLAGDPFWYQSAPSTGSETVTGSPFAFTITNTGTGLALALITFTVGGSGTAVQTFSLTNTATGEVGNYSNTQTAGDEIILDATCNKVTVATVDKTNYFDGFFPRLAVGANALSLAFTIGNISEVAWQYTPRNY